MLLHSSISARVKSKSRIIGRAGRLGGIREDGVPPQTVAPFSFPSHSIPCLLRGIPNSLTALNAVRECKRPPESAAPNPSVRPSTYLSSPGVFPAGAVFFIHPGPLGSDDCCKSKRRQPRTQCGQDCSFRSPTRAVFVPRIFRVVDQVVWISLVTPLRVVS